jgi:abortive infection bacteriophage resistance protein
MIYKKRPLSFEEQADLLISRGLKCNREKLINRLNSVNYYRLSGYLYPFKQKDNENYKEGTKFSLIYNRYRFDRRLRFLVLDGIERIEVALKTDIANKFSLKFGAFGYLEKSNLPLISEDKYDSLMKIIKVEARRGSKDQFVKHFNEKYGDSHSVLPLWLAVVLMSFGTILTFFHGLPTDIKQVISRKYMIHDSIFSSWLISLNVIRNICAHHSRLWNKVLGYKPKIPNKNDQWKSPISIVNNRLFTILSIIKYMLDIIVPTSKWPERLLSLFEEFPEIPMTNMGFPDNWKKHKIWNGEPKIYGK